MDDDEHSDRIIEQNTEPELNLFSKYFFLNWINQCVWQVNFLFLLKFWFLSLLRFNVSPYFGKSKHVILRRGAGENVKRIKIYWSFNEWWCWRWWLSTIIIFMDSFFLSLVEALKKNNHRYKSAVFFSLFKENCTAPVIQLGLFSYLGKKSSHRPSQMWRKENI